MNIENINSIIPTEIEKQIQGKDSKIYTPKIWYNYIDRLWKCEYTELKNMNDLLCHIEGESIEELIGKVWEHIESKEYGEIYDLTYNFKEYEI